MISSEWDQGTSPGKGEIVFVYGVGNMRVVRRTSVVGNEYRDVLTGEMYDRRNEDYNNAIWLPVDGFMDEIIITVFEGT